MPFYSVSGALTLFYAFSDVNSGTVANAFDVSGRGEFAGLHWRQHLTPMGAYSHSFEAGLDDRFFDNNVVFGTHAARRRRAQPPDQLHLSRALRPGRFVDHAASLQYARNLGGGVGQQRRRVLGQPRGRHARLAGAGATASTASGA